jgi:hypothetical protein
MATCLQDSPMQVPMSVGFAIERMVFKELRTLVEQGASNAIDQEILARLESASRRVHFSSRLVAEAAVVQMVANVQRESLSNAGFAPYGSRWWNPLAVQGFVEAMTLRGIDRAIGILDDEAPPDRHAPASFPYWRFDDYYFDSFADHWWTVQKGIEMQEAARRLSLFALTLEAERGAGATEAELERVCREHTLLGTPPLGELIQVERDPSGGFLLSLPRTSLHWAKLRAHLPSRLDFPWVWRILPPAPAFR